MSVKSYPNKRDCEHGQLSRSCPICAADAEYAALLACHNALRHNTKVIIKAYRENRKKYNALVEAVAWERECNRCGDWINIKWWDVNEIDQHEIWGIWEAARAEVDRLIANERGDK